MKSGKIYLTAAIGAGIVCIAAMLGVLSAAIYAEDEKMTAFRADVSSGAKGREPCG